MKTDTLSAEDEIPNTITEVLLSIAHQKPVRQQLFYTEHYLNGFIHLLPYIMSYISV